MASTTVEQGLFELGKQHWQAIKDNDADAAIRLTDDQCILTGAAVCRSNGYGNIPGLSCGDSTEAPVLRVIHSR